MQEASTYIKGILDRAVADLKAKFEANQEQVSAEVEQLEAQVDAQVAEFKAQVDQSVQEGKERIESYVNSQDDVTLKRAAISLQADVAEPETEQSRMEALAAKVEEALISYGYDQAAVDQWLTKFDNDWDNLHREQEIARAQLAQQQMLEVSNFVKGIVDAAVVDLRARDEANVEQVKAELDQAVADFKGQLDESV